MTRKVIEAVNKARKLFKIKDFPGNFLHCLKVKIISTSVSIYGTITLKIEGGIYLCYPAPTK